MVILNMSLIFFNLFSVSSASTFDSGNHVLILFSDITMWICCSSILDYVNEIAAVWHSICFADVQQYYMFWSNNIRKCSFFHRQCVCILPLCCLSCHFKVHDVLQDVSLHVTFQIIHHVWFCRGTYTRVTERKLIIYWCSKNISTRWNAYLKIFWRNCCKAQTFILS